MAAQRILCFLLLSSLTACTSPGPSLPSTPAASPIGVVMMHGKGGPPRSVGNVKAALEQHGYLVATPEMCWSDRRMYDRLYPECVTEIDAAVTALRQRGARSIVVAGHSMGGTAAIAYGASHDGLAGVIGFAAADAYYGPLAQLPDIARAQSLVRDGKGDILGEFGDIRPSGRFPMRTTASHFLSFMTPPGTDMMPANAARLRAPLLLIPGTRDPSTLQYEAQAYPKAPNYALNRFVRVNADHGGTLDAGMTSVLDWLASIARGS